MAEQFVARIANGGSGFSNGSRHGTFPDQVAEYSHARGVASPGFARAAGGCDHRSSHAFAGGHSGEADDYIRHTATDVSCRAARRDPGDDPRGRKRLPGLVRGADDRYCHPGRGCFHGRAAPAGRWHDPGKQYRADRRVCRVVDRGRRDFHDPRTGHPGVLAGLPLFLGAGDRRPRWIAGGAVFGAAAPDDDRRGAIGVSRRQGGGRSAQGRRKPRAGRPHPRAGRRDRCAGEACRGKWFEGDSRQRGRLGLHREVPGLHGDQPLAGLARRRLYRWPECRHRRGLRQRPVVQHRHSDLPGIFPR